MTVLLIDAGNSRSKCAFLQEQSLTRVKSVANEDLISYLQSSGRDRASHLLISSVAGAQVGDAVSQWATQQKVELTQIKTPRYGFGVVNGYEENYRNLGVDRWLAIVAARQQYKGPQIVADLGTAITIDLLDEFGQHHGGWIVPGYELLQQSIAERAPGVFRTTITPPMDKPLGFARNTDIALQSGALATLLGLLESARACAKMSLHTQIDPRICLTGGAAVHIKTQLPANAIVDEKLVLKGLALYAAELAK